MQSSDYNPHSDRSSTEIRYVYIKRQNQTLVRASIRVAGGTFEEGKEIKKTHITEMYTPFNVKPSKSSKQRQTREFFWPAEIGYRFWKQRQAM